MSSHTYTANIGFIAFVGHEQQGNVANNVTSLEAAIDKGLHFRKGRVAFMSHIVSADMEDSNRSTGSARLKVVPNIFDNFCHVVWNRLGITLTTSIRFLDRP
jgi:hypothetical protein